MAAMTRTARARSLFVATALFSAVASAAAAQDSFAGKQIDFYIGYDAGTGYDTYARAMGEHIGRFLPGGPSVIPRNMPGASGMRVMNFLYQAARKDGTAWGAIDRTIATETLLYGDDSKAGFKSPLEFNWIGSLNTEIGVAAVWHTTGIKSWEETRTRPTIVAMASSQGGVAARALNSILGTEFQQVCCYGGDPNQNLAMERGEVEGRIGWSWSSLKASSMNWLDSGKIRILMQVGLQKNPEIPGDPPLVVDLAPTAKDRAALKIIFGNQSMGRPYVMPPDVPAARVADVRRAFVAMAKDPAFLADAEKRHLEINDPKSGDEITALLADLYGSPPDAIAAAREAIKSGEIKMRDERQK
jgi:tripartite-type tricarboxylate transporter receptor subunit TctC